MVVDVGARVLRRDGIDIDLAPKVFDLLVILVSNQPNAVTHQQLHDALWPGVHVSATSLPALVTQLRKALDDGSSAVPAIRTLHRVGYAFVGDAVLAGPTPDSGAPACRLTWRRQSTEVPAGESVIGRDRRCAVRIDADSVSRRHARLNVTAHGISIEDLGSKNGTWVEGERIHGAVPLTDGISFRLGSEPVHFEIIVDDRRTRTATVP